MLRLFYGLKAKQREVISIFGGIRIVAFPDLAAIYRYYQDQAGRLFLVRKKQQGFMTQRSHSASQKPAWQHVFGTFGIWIVLLVSIVLVLRAAMMPPPSLPANASPVQFSAQRALEVSMTMGVQLPHATGSPQIELVRSRLSDRLRQLGLQVTETTAPAISNSDHTIQVGLATNIVGRLPGSDSTRPVVLTTHYDSGENSPGAGGDTAGVLVILEVLRALRSGPMLRNDVIVLLTDGQQDGHLGSTYAVNTDRSLSKAGLIVDISNHGNTGVPLLYRSSEGNHRLLQLFAKGVPFPSASSFASEFADLMEDPTDFEVFRTLKEIPAVSLGTLGGTVVYHQATDTQSRLSAGLLQQLGENCLNLTRLQGNENLNANPLLSSQNDVFFNWYGHHLIHYPRRSVVPMLLAALLVFALMLYRSLRQDKRWYVPFTKGLSAALLLLLCAPAGMLCMWWCIDRITPAALLTSNPTAKLMMFLSFLVFGFAVTAAMYNRLRRSFRLPRLLEGSLVLGAALVVDMSMAFRESSYLCFWPWVFAAFVYLGSRNVPLFSPYPEREVLGPEDVALRQAHVRDGLSTSGFFVAYLGALPSLMLLPFLFYLLFQVMSLGPAFMVSGGFLLGGALITLLPLLEKLSAPQLAWKIPSALVLSSFTLFAVGLSKRAPSATYPQPDSLLYAMNTDSGKAAWVSLYAGEAFSSDRWLQQRLTKTPTRERLPDLLGGYDSYVLWKPAARLENAPQPPSVEVTDSFGTATDYHLKLHVTQSPLSREVRIHLPPADIYSAAVEGQKLTISDPEKPITPEQQANPEPLKPWAIHFYGFPGKSIDLWLHFRSGECGLMVAERLRGLPLLQGSPVPARPAQYVPARVSDDTVLSRKLFFCRQ